MRIIAMVDLNTITLSVGKLSISTNSQMITPVVICQMYLIDDYSNFIYIKN